MTDVCTPATYSKTDVDASHLERSLSLPPSRRKNTKVLNVKSVPNDMSRLQDGNHKNHEPAENVPSSSRRQFSSKSFRVPTFNSSKKVGIRVSKFNPSAVTLPQDVMIKIRNVEERSLQEAIRGSNITNGLTNFSPIDENMPDVPTSSVISSKRQEKSKTSAQSNIHSLFKLLQDGVRRIGQKPTNHESSYCVIKTVEIVREPNQNLGIFIKSKKVSPETETAMQSGKNNRKHSLSSREGIFISRLSQNCMAAKQGLVQVGDEILAVNTVHVGSLDIQMVATMMCMVKRLILTVRTLKSNLNKNIKSGFDKKSIATSSSCPVSAIPRSPNFDVEKQSKVFKMPSLHSLPEESVLSDPPVVAKDKNDNVSLSKRYQINSNNNAKHSMYDNDFVVQDKVILKKSEDQSVLSKFDESFQILLDAIAGCDKSKNDVDSGNLAFEKNDNLFNSAGSLNYSESNHSDLQRNVEKHFSESSETPSLLDEILDTVKSDENFSHLKNCLSSDSVSDNCRSLESSDHGIYQSNTSCFESTSEPDYDEVAGSDNEDIVDGAMSFSNTFSSQEVNLDEFSVTMSLLPQGGRTHVTDILEQPSCSQNLSTSSSSSSVGAASLNNDHASTSVSNKYGRSVPKFPVAMSNAPQDTLDNTNLPSTSTQWKSSITVDKKREWLSNGPVVSEELKKRIDGYNIERTNSSSNPPLLSVTDDNKAKSQEYFSRSNSKESNSGSEPPKSPPLARSLSNKSLEKFKLSNHVSSRTKKVSHPTDLIHTPNNLWSNTNTAGGISSLAAKRLSNPSIEVSGPDNSAVKESNDKMTSVIHQPHSHKSVSPNRSRRRPTWRMFSNVLKFKNIGGSDSPVSEYTCWTVDEISGPSAPTTVDSLPKQAISRRDSAVINRYHLDISMAHQRRLSRQLILDNRSKETPQRTLSLSQFQKYKPMPVFDSRFSDRVDGCLVITLYGVRDLKKTLCEAYCIVQIDNATTKRIGTTMQTCKGSTTWNQCFEMIVNQAKDLHLSVYTWDTRGGRHKVTAHSTLNLPLLIQNSKSSSQFSNRLAVSLEPRGTLYLRVSMERNPATPGPLLFGADLQSIIDREKSGHLVPTLVKSCIEEVEKRGLHVVGIYRLCGSAIVKKDLRRKLEEGKEKIELSASHYPDVNVITGILKDFLRELPQPLFPPELLEAVTTAMEKNPGPTPAVVVKEAFAPDPSFTLNQPISNTNDSEQKVRTDCLLECIKHLPAAPTEQATLFALMNHLKTISVHSHKNKMICQNLAVCFGPVLLGPVSASRGNGMDLDAAIGFKRHIQVLNYMISNWPTEPVQFPGINEAKWKRLSKTVDKDSNRVSLTRRLSRVYVIDDVEVDESDDLPRNNSDELLRSNHRASLASISETTNGFSDPALYDDATRH